GGRGEEQGRAQVAAWQSGDEVVEGPEGHRGRGQAAAVRPGPHCGGPEPRPLRTSCCRRPTAAAAVLVASTSGRRDGSGAPRRRASSAHPATAISGLLSSWATPEANWRYSDGSPSGRRASAASAESRPAEGRPAWYTRRATSSDRAEEQARVSSVLGPAS